MWSRSIWLVRSLSKPTKAWHDIVAYSLVYFKDVKLQVLFQGFMQCPSPFHSLAYPRAGERRCIEVALCFHRNRAFLVLLECLSQHFRQYSVLNERAVMYWKILQSLAVDEANQRAKLAKRAFCLPPCPPLIAPSPSIRHAHCHLHQE